MLACRPSVCLVSVMLVDCDQIVQQKVEMDTWQNRCRDQQHAADDPNHRIYPVIPNSTGEGQRGMENVEFCTSTAIISESNGSRVALSQHLLSSLLLYMYASRFYRCIK